MKIRLTLVLLCFLKMSYGQYDGEATKFCIETPLLSYIDGYNGLSYRFGAETKIKNNYSVYMEGGGFFPESSGTQSMFNVKGYTTKIEFKAYVDGDDIGGDYIALDAFYKKQEYNWTDTIKLTPKYVTTFRQYKTIECFDLKFGHLYVSKSGFLYDFFAGLGVRLRQGSSSLTEAQFDSIDDLCSDGDGDCIMSSLWIGKYVGLNLEAGIRVGFSFVKDGVWK